MLVLDTNILIAHLGGEQSVTDKIYSWKQQGIALAISTITECELFSYPRISDPEAERIQRFLSETFLIFPFDSIRARSAGKLRSMTPKLKLPDSAIASLALELSAS